jgi:integrase
MTDVIQSNRSDLATRLRGLASWKVPRAVKADVLRFLDDQALGKVNRGRKISGQRQLKYFHLLRVPLEFFGKDTAALGLRDVEAFERALSDDTLRSRLKNRAYAHATKVDMRVTLRVFLRWRLGESKAMRLAGWLDTRRRRQTPDYLKEAEVEALLRQCRTAEQRYLVAVLFDSGARAAEFLNIRLEDIQLPEGKMVSGSRRMFAILGAWHAAAAFRRVYCRHVQSTESEDCRRDLPR